MDCEERERMLGGVRESVANRQDESLECDVWTRYSLTLSVDAFAVCQMNE